MENKGPGADRSVIASLKELAEKATQKYPLTAKTKYEWNHLEKERKALENEKKETELNTRLKYLEDIRVSSGKSSAGSCFNQ